jgi:hypothetical protein
MTVGDHPITLCDDIVVDGVVLRTLSGAGIKPRRAFSTQPHLHSHFGLTTQVEALLYCGTKPLRLYRHRGLGPIGPTHSEKSIRQGEGAERQERKVYHELFLSKQLTLRPAEGKISGEMLVGPLSRLTTPLRAGKKALLQEVRLKNILECFPIFTERRCDRLYTNWPAIKFINNQ